MKKIKQMSVGRILINHLILWPIIHAILGFATAGAWLLIGWIVQIVSLCFQLNTRSKYKDQQHQELLRAVQEGRR